jgi:hypothetical protein
LKIEDPKNVENRRPKEEEWKNLLRLETQRKSETQRRRISSPNLEPLSLVFDLFGDSVFAWFCGFVPLLADRRKEFQERKKQKKKEFQERRRRRHERRINGFAP